MPIEITPEDIAAARQELGTAEESPDLGGLEGFLKSSVSSPLEFFGASPLPGVQKFRSESPFAGFLSEVVGLGGVYGGAFAATKRVKKFEELLDRVRKGTPNEIVGGAAAAAARFAPLEVAAGVSRVTLGDEDIGESAMQALLNLGIEGGLGAVGGAVSAAGKRIARDRVAQAVDVRQNKVVQLRQTKDAIRAEGLDDATLVRLREQAQNLQREIFAESADELDKMYLGRKGKNDTFFEGGIGAFDITERELKFTNTVFKTTPPGEAGTTLVRRRNLTRGPSGFGGDTQKRSEVFNNFLVDDQFAENAQYPRYINFTDGRKISEKRRIEAAQQFKDEITGVWKYLGQNGQRRFYGIQAEQGREFIVLERLPGKKVVDDEWLAYRTDSVGLQRRLPKQANWADKASTFSMRLGQELNARFDFTRVAADISNDVRSEALDVLKNSSVANRTVDFIDDVPIIESSGINSPQGARKLAKRLGIEDLEAVNRLGDFFKRYFSPLPFQLNKSALARQIVAVAKFADDIGQLRASTALGGRATLRQGNLLNSIIRGPATTSEDGLEQIIRRFDEEDLEQLWQINNTNLQHGLSVQKLKSALANAQPGTPGETIGTLRPNVEAYLKQQFRSDAANIIEIRALAEKTGRASPDFSGNHIGLTRGFAGDFRGSLVNTDTGNTVYVLAGRSRAEIQRRAEQMIALAKERDQGWELREVGPVERREDFERLMGVTREDIAFGQNLQREAAFKARQPGYFKRAAGKLDKELTPGIERPWTKEELIKGVREHHRSVARFIAEQVFDLHGNPMLTALAESTPDLIGQVRQRIDDVFLRQSIISKKINNVFDQALAPALGVNSASKIVQAANGMMFHFLLGLGNVGFAAINSLTFLQTTLPQASFVLSAPSNRVAKYYSSVPIFDKQGLYRTQMGFLDPIRMVREAWRNIRQPSKEFRSAVERAAVEGVWDPRFVEQWVGENAEALSDFRTAFQSPGGFANWIKELSTFAPSVTERGTRLHAFATGYNIGKDFYKLDGDQLYLFAKEFTNNSMFLYSQADRPRYMTGPLGTALGLFKNWQMHQMHWIAEFMGEGVRGNWAPMFWQNMGVGAVGGAGAVPGFALADLASKWLTDESLLQNVYETMGNPDGSTGFADAIMFGLPSTLGVSMQGSATAPFANPVRDATALTSFVYVDRGKAVSTAAGTAFDTYFTTGKHPAESRDAMLQIMKAAAPKTFYRAYDVMGDRAISSWRTGNPLIKDVGPGEAFMYSVGLTPTQVEKKFAVANELWNDQQKRRRATQRFGEAIAQAQDSRDYKEATNLLLQAQWSGLDISAVMRSAQARLYRFNQDQIDRQFDIAQVLKYRGTGVVGGL